MQATLQASPSSAPAAIGMARAPDSVDASMIAAMRCVLAFSALAIIYVDPTEPARLVALTYASLALYCAWAAWRLEQARASFETSPSRLDHWVDTAGAGFLVALTEGTSSIFFFLFVFAVLVASFTRGQREGLRVAAASVLLFVAAGFVSGLGAEELNRSLIRPIYLFALGCMMAYWGGREIDLKRRLELLQAVSGRWNPRFDARRTLQESLEGITQTFDARECLLVLERPSADPRNLAFRARRNARGAPAVPVPIGEGAAQVLLRLPRGEALAYSRGAARLFAAALSPGRTNAQRAAFQDIANLLEADSVATVPYAQNDGTIGRLFLLDAARALTTSDLAFLERLVSAVAGVAGNMQVMEELVAKAADHERKRISLDVHDTTIQPYVGLRLGLEALERMAGSGSALGGRVRELLEMADASIKDMRAFVSALRDDNPRTGASLVAALREQADRSARFYGLAVEIRTDAELSVSPGLALEVHRLVAEALSNVRRHTSATRARVELTGAQGALRLRIGNESPHGRVPAFMPRSLTERAASLGGTLRVEGSDGWTFVDVVIPHPAMPEAR